MTADQVRFAVDAWDPAYGAPVDLDDDLGGSTARVDPDVELPADRWAPVPAAPGARPPGTVLFVDGVRRIDARVWLERPGGGGFGICASYAAGVAVCTDGQARLAAADVRRGLFTAAVDAQPVPPIVTVAGDYAVQPARSDRDLSLALQRSLGDAELAAAAAARAALPAGPAADPPRAAADDDLLVVDGPLRGRTHLPRTLGYIKTHRASYLPDQLTPVIGALAAGERTPLFHAGTSWDRYSWYLRLPCRPNGSWAGVVRVECSPDLDRGNAIRLATLSQAVLPRYASAEYKDHRAPQNLYPIAALERHLRRRLGDPDLLYRALRRAAGPPRSPGPR